LAVGIIIGFFLPGLWPGIIAWLIIKIIVDVPVLAGIINFVGRKNIFLYALPLILLYPYYIVITGALGILGNYNWKGRSINN